MVRRTTLAVLTLGLLALGLLAPGLLAAPPAAAKGPSQVEVHDERTGRVTLLDEQRNETWALVQLVEWPDRSKEPRAVASGRVDLIATLAWQFPDESPVWTDRVYSDGAGTTWLQRQDHLVSPATTTWGRVRQGFALEIVLSGLHAPADRPSATSVQEPAPAAPAPNRGSAASTGWDGRSFGWGVGAGLLAVGLALASRRVRQRSVTASRNSLASAPASS